VVTVSRYCAEKLEEFYGVTGAAVVPELIDLKAWRHYLQTNPTAPDPSKFTVLSACRFYPRKRLEVLLLAAAQLRTAIPELDIRIVGNGPQRTRLQAICKGLDLGPMVRWLGDVSRSRLAEEYNRCDLFCLPSAQEGFGIVFLEAMAAGKAIVAVRTSAVPEVVQNGILVDPDRPEALAEAIRHLYLNFAGDYAFSHSGLDPVLRSNFVFGYYAGGHSMYVEKPILHQMYLDVGEFIRATKPAKRPMPSVQQ